MRRVPARLAGVALSTLVGGGLGVAAFAPTAQAAVAAPVATIVVTKAAASGCATGKYQKQVEGYLKRLGYKAVTVDGKQSAADCSAIKSFQKRYGIQPANGLAGPTTVDVAQRLANTNTAACKPASKSTTFCVDLTHQTTWVMRNGKVYRAPTVVRTGKAGYRTPSGTYRINLHKTKEWSNPYHVWLPYWQRFYGGDGFHQTTTYIHDKWRGSHGCVNLLPQDAKAYYGIGKVGMTIKLFGRRPGT